MDKKFIVQLIYFNNSPTVSGFFFSDFVIFILKVTGLISIAERNMEKPPGCYYQNLLNKN